MTSGDDARFEQRAIDPAVAAAAPAIVVAALICFASCWISTEAVAQSFRGAAGLGPNVGGVYAPVAGLTWEVSCLSGRWPACRVPTRWRHPSMEQHTFERWAADSKARRDGIMSHFGVQHVVLVIGLAIAALAATIVWARGYRRMREREKSKLHGSAEWASWDEVRDAGYLAGVPAISKKR